VSAVYINFSTFKKRCNIGGTELIIFNIEQVWLVLPWPAIDQNHGFIWVV